MSIRNAHEDPSMFKGNASFQSLELHASRIHKPRSAAFIRQTHLNGIQVKNDFILVEIFLFLQENKDYYCFLSNLTWPLPAAQIVALPKHEHPSQLSFKEELEASGTIEKIS